MTRRYTREPSLENHTRKHDLLHQFDGSSYSNYPSYVSQRNCCVIEYFDGISELPLEFILLWYGGVIRKIFSGMFVYRFVPYFPMTTIWNLIKSSHDLTKMFEHVEYSLFHIIRYCKKTHRLHCVYIWYRRPSRLKTKISTIM